MTAPAFAHRMAAHCESGTVAALLNHAGLALSEPMVFGIAGGIFFGYFDTPMLPFPMFVLRNQPGKMRTLLERRLGLRFHARRFRDPDRAMEELDAQLARGIPTAVQVDFFYMDYIPAYARAHFNAHYIVVVGKEGGQYTVSDSYAPALARLDASALRTARFARGPFAPRGLMFQPPAVPEEIDWARAIRRGIRQAAFYMLYLPVPIFGIRGIRHFARKVQEWPRRAPDPERLSHEIMMIHVALEERGTGGGGFRFLYASFLQEAARRLDRPDLAALAPRMMANGDRWREISRFAARIGKNRDLGPERLQELADRIRQRADEEQILFRELYKMA